jgi:enoyl-CoA hydratase/carnithine racemase
MITDLAPRQELASVAAAIAGKIAAMPPTTLRLLKRSINRTQDHMGMRASLDYHFAVHQLGHGTRESQQLLHEERERRSLKAYFAERDKGDLG